MPLLALDTATSAISVAVTDGQEVLARRVTLDERAHGELLAPSVRDAMAEAGVRHTDLTAIVVGVGPGPFTGLRVGIVSGLVLASVAGVPVYGMCSLDAVAHEAWLQQTSPACDLVVATDARRKEVYAARYAPGPEGPERLGAPIVARPAELPEELAGLPTAGRGPVLYPDAFPRVLDVRDVDAAVMGRRAALALSRGEGERELVPLDPTGWLTYPEPWYLRRPDAQVAAPWKSVLT